MLGSLILYFKGMRRMMFQLSGFYSTSFQPEVEAPTPSEPEEPGRMPAKPRERPCTASASTSRSASPRNRFDSEILGF